MTTPRLLSALPVLLATMALAACGAQGPGVADDGPGTNPGGTATGRIEHPSGEGDVVVSVRTHGGFVPWQVAVGTQPTVLVTGDGRVFGPGMSAAVYPGPLVAPVATGRVDEGQVQDLLAHARDAGLLGDPPDYRDRGAVATDLPTTEVLVAAGGDTVRHEAYGLRGEGEETTPERRALAAFVAAAQEAVADRLTETFRPDALVVQAMAIRGARVAPANPDRAPGTWPATAGMDLAEECGVVEDPETLRMLLQARQDRRFTQDGRTWQVAARALLPGDPGCPGAA